MKKTYITTMPDQIGAFLKASECFAGLGINITRVSYNKAVDSHTLFIDAEGEAGQLEKADLELTKIGYLQTDKNENGVVLLEFMLPDVPGSVTEVLRLIHGYRLNISYISSQENGSAYQAFKMGLFVDREETLTAFLKEAQELCPVRVLDYNRSERVFDNSVFYQSFVSALMQLTGLPEEKRDVLLVNSNLVMQLLDENGLPPSKTFESISRFAELLSKCRGEAFEPRITEHKVAENTKITLIEPPCGSNTAILQSGGGNAVHRLRLCALRGGNAPHLPQTAARLGENEKAHLHHPRGCGPLRPAASVRRGAGNKENHGLPGAGSEGRERVPGAKPAPQAVCEYLQGPDLLSPACAGTDHGPLGCAG